MMFQEVRGPSVPLHVSQCRHCSMCTLKSLSQMVCVCVCVCVPLSCVSSASILIEFRIVEISQGSLGVVINPAMGNSVRLVLVFTLRGSSNSSGGNCQSRSVSPTCVCSRHHGLCVVWGPPTLTFAPEANCYEGTLTETKLVFSL